MAHPTLMVIGHEVDPETVPAQAGTLTSWAADRGVHVLPVVAGDDVGDPAAVDAIAVLGSVQGAWDDDVRWLAPEIALLERAIDVGTPVLGICFGGQLLARVLGGRALPASGLGEHGWHTITTGAPELVAPGPWMEFHFDTFVTPPRAERLAVSARSDQAFRDGAHLGVQFHPEITPASFETWAARWAGTPFEDRLPSLGVTTEGLRAETAARAEDSRRASWTLFDGFAERAGLFRRADLASHQV